MVCLHFFVGGESGLIDSNLHVAIDEVDSFDVAAVVVAVEIGVIDEVEGVVDVLLVV